MIESVFDALFAGLSLWGTKEGRKYLDKVIKLKKEWYDEFNKKKPDDAVLDYIILELRHISSTFASQVGAENAKNK